MVIGRAKEYGREERPNRKCKTNEACSHILQPLKIGIQRSNEGVCQVLAAATAIAIGRVYLCLSLYIQTGIIDP